MKKLILLVFCMSAMIFTQAQNKAVTENGDEVLLYEDGTWKYVSEELINELEITINPTEYHKSENATFLLKSNRLNLGFWLDPKVWSFNKPVDNPDAEYEFQLKDGDLYGMVISEKIEIPLENMRAIAVENGQDISPDLHIVQEEYRMVNDLKVLFLQMNGTMQGIKFSYYGYYYSNNKGTVQFITYTSQNLLSEYTKICDGLLNGLVEINE